MKTLAKFLWILLLFVSSYSLGQNKLSEGKELLKTHSVENLRNDIDFAFLKIKKLHPSLFQYISEKELDYRIDSVKNSLTKPLTSREFYFVVFPLINEIKQGHNHVAYSKENTNILGFPKENKDRNFAEKLEFEKFGEKILISDVYSEDKSLVNAELLAIGGDDISYLINKYQNLNIGDGSNETYKERSIQRLILSYYSYQNLQADSIVLRIKWNERILDTTFYRLSYYEEDYTKKDYNIPYRNLKDYDDFSESFIRNYEFVTPDSSVALLTIKQFSQSKSQDFYSLFFNILDSTVTKDLILDLRNNPGGSLSEIHDLLGYLLQEDYVTSLPHEANTRFVYSNSTLGDAKNNIIIVGKVLLSPILLFFDLSQKTKKIDQTYFEHPKETVWTKPKNNAFKGNVYVLVNGNSFSAACMVAANLQGAGRAVIVGEETGGAFNSTVAGVFKTIILPQSKLRVSFGLNNIITPYTQSPDGRGVIPDYTILPSLEHHLQGIDTELEWIKKEIITNRKLENTTPEKDIKYEEKIEE